jgi:hypothetical protein
MTGRTPTRARLRARRAFTQEHALRLEDQTASPLCTHPTCSQPPAPAQDTIEHILLHCPRHLTRRQTLSAALATHHCSATLPIILGDTARTHLLTKRAKQRTTALLQLTAQYIHDIDQERQRHSLRPFDPP